MHINTFRFKPEHVDCTLCTEYGKETGCTASGCPWLNERIEAGVVDYREAVLETFSTCPSLYKRLKLLVRLHPGTLWLDKNHRQRMERLKAQLGYRRHRDTPVFYAAMYLLTSNEDIYRRAANCFCRYGFDPSYVRLRGIDTHNYTMFIAARSICGGNGGLTLDDLADAEVVDIEALRLIINAILIARYSSAALDLRSEFKNGHSVTKGADAEWQ